jgi:hypothetical protein
MWPVLLWQSFVERTYTDSINYSNSPVPVCLFVSRYARHTGKRVSGMCTICVKYTFCELRLRRTDKRMLIFM